MDISAQDREDLPAEPQFWIPGTVQLLKKNSDGSGKLTEEIKLNPTPTTSPNDPLNWSPLRKYWHAALILFIVGLTAATSNDAGSAGDAIDAELGIDYSVQNTAAGVLFVAIGYWALLASPMPWLYGRRLQYLLCLIFSLVGAIWFSKLQSSGDLIAGQLFVGASQSCAEALAQLSLSDLFFQHRRGTVLGLYILATSVGTFLGPLVGGFISVTDWRWVGWGAVIVSAVTLVVFYFGLEETTFNREIFLGRRLEGESNTNSHTSVPDGDEKPKGISSGSTTNVISESSHIANVPYTSVEDPPKSYRQRIALITRSPNTRGLGFKQYFMRIWHTLRIFAFPAVLFSGLQWGAQDAWLSFYITTQDTSYYDDPYNYGDEAVAIMNVPTLIGAVIGCIYGGWFSDIFVKWCARRRGGVSEAEDRLWLLLASAVINPAGLMLFGIGTANGLDWPAPYVGLGFIGFGWGCSGDLALAYLMDVYPDMVLEGMVGVAVINNSLACIFTFVCSKLSRPEFRLRKTSLTIPQASGSTTLGLQIPSLPLECYRRSSSCLLFPC
jgi:MFS family permease